MEENKKPIFAAIREVFYSMCRRNKLNVPLSNKHLQRVMAWSNLGMQQACLFSFFATQSMNTSAEWWQFEDIQNYLDLETFQYAELLPEMDELISKGFFALRYDQKHVKGTLTKYTYFKLPDELEQIICYNKEFKPYKPVVSNTKNDCLAFLYRTAKEGFIEKTFYYTQLVDSLYSDDPVLSLFRNEDDWEDSFTPTEALNFFARTGSALVDGETSVSLKKCLEDIREGDPGFIIRMMKAFKEGDSFFIKKDIFKIEKNNLGDNISLSWGEWAKEQIFKGDAEILFSATKVKELGVIKSEDIKEKTLFYNPENEQDMNRLKGLLDDEMYLKMRERLEEKNMPKGLIILMYGPPGTGKTETAMQLARMTGRDLFHVNIQEVRSCWVGESEKNTKAIFESYKNSKKKKKPILLFNEADGVISKRSTLGGGKNESVDKMENAMQNIILEEFENFDGICIMTSNLLENFDPAFERRILFKMELEKPTKDVKRKIWENKLEEYAEGIDIDKLLVYDFSGGQIENIKRKVLMDEVLYGRKPTLQTLEDFCKKEKLFDKDNHKTIGFTN